MTITTRRASPDDAETLHELAARTFPLAAPADTPRADVEAFIAQNLSVESFGKYLADAERSLLIAEQEGTPVAYAMLVGGPIPDPEVAALVAAAAGPVTTVELSKFYVAAENHGRGAASTLMAATLAAARESGASYCWLGVNDRNDRASRFYAKHGFERIGSKRFQVGDTWFVDPVHGRFLA